MTTAELQITSNYIQALASMPDATERIGLFISIPLRRLLGIGLRQKTVRLILEPTVTM